MPTPLTGLQGIEITLAIPGNANYDDGNADFGAAAAIWSAIATLVEATDDADAEAEGVPIGAIYDNAGSPTIRQT